MISVFFIPYLFIIFLLLVLFQNSSSFFLPLSATRRPAENLLIFSLLCFFFPLYSSYNLLLFYFLSTFSTLIFSSCSSSFLFRLLFPYSSLPSSSVSSLRPYPFHVTFGASAVREGCRDAYSQLRLTLLHLKQPLPWKTEEENEHISSPVFCCSSRYTAIS